MTNLAVHAMMAFTLLAGSCRTDESVPIADYGYLIGAEGARLYYRVLGSGGDSIVVIHGGPGAGMNSILPSVEPLAREYVLIFYDQRGGGRSELPSDTTKLQPQYFVEDLEAVRSYFRLERMNVIAHSFGSVLLARYAQSYPNRLGRVVFHGATGPRKSEAVLYYRAKAAAGPASDTALTNHASRLLQSLLDGTAASPVLTCREYEDISRQIAIARGEPANYKGTTCAASPEAIRYYYRYTAQLAPQFFGDWDFTNGLEEVTAQLLVVFGVRDSAGIPLQKQWAEAVPNGRLLLVPDAGKAAFSENPSFVFPALEAFFRGGWPEEAISTGSF